MKDTEFKVKDIIKTTENSVEIIFENTEIDTEHKPGEFVMLSLHPREDKDWKQITEYDVYKKICEKENVYFPNLEEKTIQKMLDSLLTKQMIVLDNSVYKKGNVECPNIPPRPLKRAYSLSSTGLEKGILSTMVKEMQFGYMSHYLVQRLQIGDKVHISGPLGHFSYDENTMKDILLIGAGSGITPLMGMLRYLDQANKSETHATLLYSNTTEDNIIFRNELKEITEHNPNMQVLHTLTRQEWDGRMGRIDSGLIQEALERLDTPHIFICGTLAFAENMENLLLSLGIEKVNIKREAYG